MRGLISLLLATASVSATTVGDDGTSSTRTMLRGGSTSAPESKQRRKLISKKRYFARYSSSTGRESVRRCAKSILEDDEDTDYTVFEVDFETEIEVHDNGVSGERLNALEQISTVNNMNYDIGVHDDDMDGCLSFLRNDDDILDIEEDRPISLFQDVLPSSIDWVSKDIDRTSPSWGIKAIQADAVPPGPHKVTVCVVDTGIAINHPGFPSASSQNDNISRIRGKDSLGFGMESGSLRWNLDLNGHGTHVAGILLDVINSDRDEEIQEKHAASNDIDVFVVNAFGKHNNGYESDVLRAVRSCIGDANADVINMSLGNKYFSSFTASLYTKIVDDYGAVMVAAAGNDKDASSGAHINFYPASIPSVISVGATEEGGTRYPNSAQNNQVEIAAPGSQIDAAAIRWNSDSEVWEYVYERRSGTSCAAPHVTGAVALLKSHFPTCSNNQIRYAIAKTASKEIGLDASKEEGEDTNACDASLGYGTIQVRDAFEWLLTQTDCDDWDVAMVSEGGCTTLKGGIVPKQSSQEEGTTGAFQTVQDPNNDSDGVDEGQLPEASTGTETGITENKFQNTTESLVKEESTAYATFDPTMEQSFTKSNDTDAVEVDYESDEVSSTREGETTLQPTMIYSIEATSTKTNQSSLNENGEDEPKSESTTPINGILMNRVRDWVLATP